MIKGHPYSTYLLSLVISTSYREVNLGVGEGESVFEFIVNSGKWLVLQYTY